MANELNFDKLVIDRVVDGWFENKDLELLAVLDDIQNFQISNSSETKDKTDSQGALIKRFYQSKSAEVSGENAVFSMNLAALQMGTTKKTGTAVTMPRIMQVNATDSPIELPDTPIEGTLIVYGTFDNGVPNTELKYTKDDTAGPGKYAVATAGGVTTLTLPTDATASVQVKYEYVVAENKIAARVDQDGSSFPKECKATFRVLVSEICDPETVRALYIVFPRFQMSPDFDWSVATDSAQAFSAICLKDYCAQNQLLYYIAVAEDSDEYDTKQFQ